MEPAAGDRADRAVTDPDHDPYYEDLGRGRLPLVLRCATWGVGIGAAAGATVGTMIVPLLGTLFGAAGGASVAVVPTAIATAAYAAGATRDVPLERWARHVWRVSAGLAVAMVVLAGTVIVGVRRTDLWPADVTETGRVWALAGAGLVVALAGLAQFSLQLASSAPFLTEDEVMGT